MLSHKFSIKEIIVLVVLGVFIFAYLYYSFVYKYFQNQLSGVDVEDMSMQVEYESELADRVIAMSSEIDNNDVVLPGEIKTYNNINTAIDDINTILDGNVTGLSFIFSEPTSSDGTNVRRDATIGFTTDTCEEAFKLINDIAGCDDRLVVNTISINQQKVELSDVISETEVTTAAEQTQSSETVSTDIAATDTATSDTSASVSASEGVKKSYVVSISITMYETLEGSDNTNGIVAPDPTSASTVSTEESGTAAASDTTETTSTADAG